MTVNVKTPLSYAGGKSRFLKQLNENTPDLKNIDNFYDLFLGGGSYPIFITKKYPHINIFVNDSNNKLINFWKQLQNNSEFLIKELHFIKTYYKENNVRKIINKLRNNEIEDSFENAVAYYIANKCSFAGTTESGGFSSYNFKNKFNNKNIDKLKIVNKYIKNWNITNLDYKNINIKSNSFIYLDPPYNIKANLYGKNGDLHKYFNFNEFINFSKSINQKVLISFNDDILLNSYKNWHKKSYEHTYLMQSNKKYLQNQKNRKEIVLTNYDR